MGGKDGGGVVVCALNHLATLPVVSFAAVFSVDSVLCFQHHSRTEVHTRLRTKEPALKILSKQLWDSRQGVVLRLEGLAYGCIRLS
jgi:hypothetical protein